MNEDSMDSYKQQAPKIKVETWPLSPFVTQEQIHHWNIEKMPSYSKSSKEICKKIEWIYRPKFVKYSEWTHHFIKHRNHLRGNGLEIGAGKCRVSAILSRRKEIESIVAVELSRRRLDTYASHVFENFKGDISKMRFVEGDMHNLEIKDKSLDFVVCAGALHHADRLDIALAELARVLKPGGMLMALEEPVTAATEQTYNDLKIAPAEHEYKIELWLQSFRSAGFIPKFRVHWLGTVISGRLSSPKLPRSFRVWWWRLYNTAPLSYLWPKLYPDKPYLGNFYMFRD